MSEMRAVYTHKYTNISDDHIKSLLQQYGREIEAYDNLRLGYSILAEIPDMNALERESYARKRDHFAQIQMSANNIHKSLKAEARLRGIL